MTTFRVVGIAVKRVGAAAYDVTVEVTATADTAAAVSLGRRVLRAVSKDDLLSQSRTIVEQCKATHVSANLELDIVSKTLASASA